MDKKRGYFITNELYINSPISNVDHAINVHEDIASILDRHIDTDVWRTPKMEKISVQTKCTNCNIKIYTRVEEEWKEVEEERTRTGSCPGHSCDCGSCDWTGIILLMFCACLVYILCSVLNSGKEGSKVYRHFCPACNALVGEYNPKRRAA